MRQHHIHKALWPCLICHSSREAGFNVQIPLLEEKSSTCGWERTNSSFHNHLLMLCRLCMRVTKSDEELFNRKVRHIHNLFSPLPPNKIMGLRSFIYTFKLWHIKAIQPVCSSVKTMKVIWKLVLQILLIFISELASA